MPFFSLVGVSWRDETCGSESKLQPFVLGLSRTSDPNTSYLNDLFVVSTVVSLYTDKKKNDASISFCKHAVSKKSEQRLCFLSNLSIKLKA